MEYFFLSKLTKKGQIIAKPMPTQKRYIGNLLKKKPSIAYLCCSNFLFLALEFLYIRN